MRKNVVVLACNFEIDMGRFCLHDEFLEKLPSFGDCSIIGHESCFNDIEKTRLISDKVSFGQLEPNRYLIQDYNFGYSLRLWLFLRENQIDNIWFIGKLPWSFHSIRAKHQGICKANVTVISPVESIEEVEFASDSNFIQKAIQRFLTSYILNWKDKDSVEIKVDTSSSISIIVPHFNHGKYLEECIESLMHQMDDGDELIVVDDGSTDTHSVNKLSELEIKYRDDHRLKVNYQLNAGVGAARNFGVSLAQNDFVLFFDSDNIAMDQLLRVSRSTILITKSDVVAIPNIYLDENVANLQIVGFWPIGGIGGLTWFRNYLGDSTFIAKKEVIEKIGGFNIQRRATHQDWEILMRMTLLGFDIEVTSTPLYYYRITENSMSSSIPHERGLELIGRSIKDIDWNVTFKSELADVLMDFSSDFHYGRFFGNSTVLSYNNIKFILDKYFPINSRRREFLKLAFRNLNGYKNKLETRKFRRLTKKH